MDDVEVRRGYFPGAIGRVVELHGTYYHTHWRFGAFFEAQVASQLAEFFGGYDQLRDGFWIATVSGRVEGAITIDGAHAADDGAHLRWFIMSEALRGRGDGYKEGFQLVLKVRRFEGFSVAGYGSGAGRSDLHIR